MKIHNQILSAGASSPSPCRYFTKRCGNKPTKNVALCSHPLPCTSAASGQILESCGHCSPTTVSELCPRGRSPPAKFPADCSQPPGAASLQLSACGPALAKFCQQCLKIVLVRGCVRACNTSAHNNAQKSHAELPYYLHTPFGAL